MPICDQGTMSPSSRETLNQQAAAQVSSDAIRVAVIDAADMAGGCVFWSFKSLLDTSLLPQLVTPAGLLETLSTFDVVFCPGGSHRQALDSLDEGGKTRPDPHYLPNSTHPHHH